MHNTIGKFLPIPVAFSNNNNNNLRVLLSLVGSAWPLRRKRCFPFRKWNLLLLFPNGKQKISLRKFGSLPKIVLR